MVQVNPILSVPTAGRTAMSGVPSSTAGRFPHPPPHVRRHRTLHQKVPAPRRGPVAGSRQRPKDHWDWLPLVTKRRCGVRCHE